MEKLKLETRQVLDTTVCKLPKEVMDEIHDLWIDNELGNDVYYYHWNSNNEETRNKYPILAKFLIDNDIIECEIHHWW